MCIGPQSTNRHTHDLVAQVFSRISVWLNRNDVLCVSHLMHGLGNGAYKPHPNVKELDSSIDVKQWLGPNVPGRRPPNFRRDRTSLLSDREESRPCGKSRTSGSPRERKQHYYRNPPLFVDKHPDVSVPPRLARHARRKAEVPPWEESFPPRGAKRGQDGRHVRFL